MELPPVSEFSSAQLKARSRRRAAAIFVGPILCWLVPVVLGFAISVVFPRGWQNTSLLNNFWPFFWLIYLVCSSLFCGFAAAFFLRAEGFQTMPRDEALRRLGCWTRGIFIFPICLMVCCGLGAVVLVPLHLALFDFAFSRGVIFWNSQRPREWLGDFENRGQKSENGD